MQFTRRFDMNYKSFGLAVSVWGHFGRDISVHKQLIALVYLNDYIDRRNVTLAGVIQT